MEYFNLEVMERPKGSDSVLHHLRDDGFVPGVIYGHQHNSELIQLNERELLTQLKKYGQSGIFEVTLNNEKIPVKINELQKDVIGGRIMHVDLQAISLNEMTDMSVPIHFFGKPIGEKNGGMIQQQLRHIEVRALPSATPEHIQVNIADLDIGDALFVRDILMPDGVKVLSDGDMLVLSILPPNRVEEILTQEPTSEPEIVNARDGRGIDAAK